MLVTIPHCTAKMYYSILGSKLNHKVDLKTVMDISTDSLGNNWPSFSLPNTGCLKPVRSVWWLLMFLPRQSPFPIVTVFSSLTKTKLAVWKGKFPLACKSPVKHYLLVFQQQEINLAEELGSVASSVFHQMPTTLVIIWQTDHTHALSPVSCLLRGKHVV